MNKSKTQLFFEMLKKCKTDKYDNLLVLCDDATKQYLKNYRLKQRYFNILNRYRLQQKLYKTRILFLDLVNK